MEFQRSLRIRKPMENPLPHLGKSLSHHQVIPAVQALRSANKPRVDAIKRGFNASAHAGHPLVGAVAKGIRSKMVGQGSPLDAKNILASSVKSHLGYTPHSKSLVGV